MLIKQVHGNYTTDFGRSEDLIRDTVSVDTDSAVQQLSEIVGRMLDAMVLTDQQRLDIIDPYGWEIIPEARK